MINQRIIYVIILLAHCGCKVGPNYHARQMSMPEKYELTSANETKTSLKNWWENFEDPQLNLIITTAISQNYDLMVALDRVKQARAFFFIDRANLLPEIDTITEAERFRVSQALVESPFLGPPEQNFYRLGFEASWELDFFGRLRRAKEASFYHLQAEGFNFRDVYISIISDAARYYVEIRALQEIIWLINKNIALKRQIAGLRTDLFTSGLGDEITVTQIEAELAALEATLPDFKSELKQNIFALSVILGQFPEATQHMLDNEGSMPYSTSMANIGVPGELLRRRPDIRRAERDLAAATAEIGVAVADLFPTITLTGAYGFESSKMQNWFTNTARSWGFGPQIFWPLLDFGRVRNNIRSKEAFRDQAFHTYVQKILAAVAEVESALVAYLERQKNSAQFKKETLNYQKAMLLNEDLFQAGLIDQSTYLSAKLTYIESQQRLIESRKTEMENLINLYKTVGGDW